MILLGFNMLWQVGMFCTPSRGKPQQVERMESLLDIPNFSYIYNNENRCTPQEALATDKLLITLVHSARANVDNRETIRRTWGGLQRLMGWEIRIMFLVGLEDSNDQNSDRQSLNMVNSSIETENKRYNDILMGNFLDVYRNLPYKHLMGYKWILDYCPNANFLLRIDDDMFVNIFEVINFLTIKPLAEHDTFFCYAMRNRPVERGNNSKWRVTREEYEVDKYPDYCLGAGYLANTGVVPKLYSVQNLLNYFWIEDVFIGLLTEFYNSRFNASSQRAIKIENISGKYEFYKYNITERIWEDNLWMFTLMAKSNILDGAMERLWNRTRMN